MRVFSKPNPRLSTVRAKRVAAFSSSAKALTEALPKAITPAVPNEIANIAKKAIDYNIPLSRSQISGSEAAKITASALGKIPLGGSAGFAREQQRALNREVLSTIGADGNKATPEILSKTFKKITNGFNEALKGQRVKLNDAMIEQLTNLERKANSDLLTEDYKTFTKQMGKIINEIEPDGAIKGEKLGQLRSDFSKLSNSYPGQLKVAMRDLKKLVQDISVDGAPERKEILQDSINKFRNYAILKPLLKKTKNGDISTSLLVGQVANKVHDFEQGGGGKLGDLARISRDLLKDTIPDSATAQRSLVYKGLEGAGGLAATGAAVMSPAAAAGVGVPLGITQAFNRANQSQRFVKNALGVKSKIKIPKSIYDLPPAEAIKAIQELQNNN